MHPTLEESNGGRGVAEGEEGEEGGEGRATLLVSCRGRWYGRSAVIDEGMVTKFYDG